MRAVHLARPVEVSRDRDDRRRIAELPLEREVVARLGLRQRRDLHVTPLPRPLGTSVGVQAVHGGFQAVQPERHDIGLQGAVFLLLGPGLGVLREAARHHVRHQRGVHGAGAEEPDGPAPFQHGPQRFPLPLLGREADGKPERYGRGPDPSGPGGLSGGGSTEGGEVHAARSCGLLLIGRLPGR